MHTLFLKKKEQTSEKMSEQCFSGKIKPICQNSAISEQFQKWLKNVGDILSCGLSIVPKENRSLYGHFHNGLHSTLLVLIYVTEGRWCLCIQFTVVLGQFISGRGPTSMFKTKSYCRKKKYTSFVDVYSNLHFYGISFF